MADKENIQHPTDSLKRKRSRHWDLEETKNLVNNGGEDNIQERLKSCTRFFKIFDDNKKIRFFVE